MRWATVGGNPDRYVPPYVVGIGSLPVLRVYDVSRRYLKTWYRLRATEANLQTTLFSESSRNDCNSTYILENY